MSHDRAPEYDEADADDLPRTPEAAVALNETEARQAVPIGRMRYVLGISLALVVGGFTVVYLVVFG